MTTTWNDVRRNLNDRLNRLDYADMERVEAGKVRMTETGKNMAATSTGDGRFNYRTISVRKLLKFGLVTEASPGEYYQLTDAGRDALAAWRDSRAATYPTPTEGPSS